MKTYSMLLRGSFALLVGTVTFALLQNLPVIGGHMSTSPRISVRTENHPLRFVIVSPLYDHPFWMEVWNGAREAEGVLNVNVDMTGPRRASLDDQIELLEMAAAAQVDGIITQGVPDERLALAIEKAADRGIPTVTISTDVQGRRLAHVGMNHHLAGRLAAEELIRRTGGTAVVAIIRGGLGPAEQDDRVRGFLEGLDGQNGMRVVAVEASEMNRTIAAQKALTILEERPDVTAFYGTTKLDVAGIGQSVAAVGRLPRIEIVQAIEDPPATLGQTAVTLLEAYLRRDVRPPQHVDVMTGGTGGGTP